MIHRGRVPSIVTSAIEHRHAIDQFEGRQRRRRQEIPLGAVNQQHGAVDFLHRVLVRFRPRGLHAGVEHADGLDAWVATQRDREKSSAGLAHDGDLIGRDLPFQGRAGTHILFLRPIDRFSEVVRILLPALSAGLWYGADHEKAVGRDRREEPRVARAVDGAAAVAPCHHGQLVFPGKFAGILRAKNDVTRRAERRLRRDLVWTGNRLRRAVERQCCGDQIIPNRRLSETDGRGENGGDDESVVFIAGSLMQPRSSSYLLWTVMRPGRPADQPLISYYAIRAGLRVAKSARPLNRTCVSSTLEEPPAHSLRSRNIPTTTL